MRHKLLRMGLFLWLSGLVVWSQDSRPDYVGQIQPILAQNCYACHGCERSLGGIRLDIKAGAFRQGDSGHATIVPGNSAASELIRRVTATEKSLRMPLAGEPLPPAQIDLLRDWIDSGASWPEGSGGEPSGNLNTGEMRVTERDRSHWAFRPLETTAPPAVQNTSWVRNPIDRFIRAAQEAKGLEPVAPATKEQLIRRAYFTLTGLPPAPEEVEAFRKDPAPNAYEVLIDRLLASPHYGERWGRHWLDVARYADSEGYNRDPDRPVMYRYRDFVIRAMNDDMPYDQFVRWQIAGDEYEPENPEALIATGFLAAGPREMVAATDTEENKQKYFYDELDDFVSTTSLAMLGLTVGCARCHDHKFDPIPTRDYYRLVAAFRNIERKETYLSRPHRELERWVAARRLALREEKMEAAGIPEDIRVSLRAPLDKNNSGQAFFYRNYDDKLQFTEDEFRAWLSPEDRATLERLQREVEKVEKGLGGKPLQSNIVEDCQAEPLDSFLLGRGNVLDRKESVPFGVLTVLSRGREPEQYRSSVYRKGVATSFQRSAVAEWLVDAEHGAGHLLARVLVNRLWQHHFGEGLVRSPNDFGMQGDRPSHPELLDWLAGELVRGGWRIKPIHRLIMTSAVFQLSTRYDKPSAEADPDNRLLWRRRPLRLEAEVLRDSILAVSGALNPQMYGPGVRPYIPPEATVTRSRDKWPKEAADGPETWRRSVYIFNKRSVRYPWLETFDAPDWVLSCGQRVPTTVPTQSLALMNDAFVREQARRFAARLISEVPGGGFAERVRRAYQLALGRPPSPKEMDESLTFLHEPQGAPEAERLTDFSHVVFTLNEFLYVD